MDEKCYWYSDKLQEFVKRRAWIIVKVENEEPPHKHQRSDPNLIDSVFVVVFVGFFFLSEEAMEKMEFVILRATK